MAEYVTNGDGSVSVRHHGTFVSVVCFVRTSAKSASRAIFGPSGDVLRLVVFSPLCGKHGASCLFHLADTLSVWICSLGCDPGVPPDVSRRLTK
jgi:hypothetical protein